MKKVISLFLSAMMILTSVLCVNFSAFAKDIESGSIKLGKNTVKASDLFTKMMNLIKQIQLIIGTLLYLMKLLFTSLNLIIP